MRILARSAASCQSPTWQRDLAAAVTSLPELLDLLGLDADRLPGLAGAPTGFPLLVPRAYVERMQPATPQDPLLLQVLPLAAELEPCPGFVADPVGDGAAMRTPGLLQKYAGRALMIATGACALHCRFCFRRHAPQGAAASGGERLAAALAALVADRSIGEVILSGGDPLVLDDAALSQLIDRLAAIPHLRRLRLHSRVPVALPSRIDVDLCRLLTRSRLQAVLVVHVNHAQELGPAARAALAGLRKAGLLLLSQSVLLKGVNDDAERLCQLSDALVAAGVLPYYLHLLDPVQGAAHFEVGERQACALVAEMRRRLPGYLVPRLVRERIGQPSKTPIS